MRYLNILLLIALFCLTPSYLLAKNKIVYFEPKTVELDGIIRILTFPGQPNYENIKNGDADETGPYLILKNPVDVNLALNGKTGNNEPTKNIKLIQLIVQNDSDLKKLKKLNDGYKAHIVGTLFSAQTGHHHARVLLRVNKINIFSMHSMQKVLNKKLNVTQEDQQFLKYQHLQN